MKKICCINDMPGVGKIALSAMIPILSAKGINTASLPTALVSNTLDFGKFDILDTTNYMEKTVDIWHELGFRFDCISTGFLVNPKQIDIIEKLIDNQDRDNLIVVVDPIMGDEGKLYNGMTENNVAIMRRLSSYADILIPNFTEACFLTNHFYESATITTEQAEDLLNRCRALGAKSIIITSSFVDGQTCVIGYDHTKNETFKIDFEQIDVRFPGTGDIFSASLISDVLNGESLFDSTYHAMQIVKDIIQDNLNKKEKFSGVDIEKYISEGKLSTTHD
ncbi:Pyridoxine kinase [Clostridiales bacterium CHKCI001]|nr:Pyridoxine kinase [Clostridiales bacterium CHKCI001]